MSYKTHELSRILWLLCLLPTAVFAQKVIDIGLFEEDLRISNYLYNAGLGRSVKAGDVNGDGIDDLLAGAETAERFHLGGGCAFLVFGRSALPRFIDLENSNQRVVLWGNGPQDYTGDFVDIFDFSGDGLADVFISAPQWNFAGGNQGRGKIYFLQGRANWPGEILLQDYPTDSLAATLHGERPQAYLGSGSAHGDFNGDGFDDLVLILPDADANEYQRGGTGFILWGRDAWPEFIDLRNWASDASVTRLLGRRYSSMVTSRLITGDFNGNGISDLVVQAFISHVKPKYPTDLVQIYLDPFKVRPKVFDYFDPQLRPTVVLDRHHTQNGSRSFPYFLASVDWNDDGLDDLAISDVYAWRRSPALADEGMVYVIYGSRTLPDTIDFRSSNATWEVIWGGSRLGGIGQSMTRCDLDADAKDDLVLGDLTSRKEYALGLRWRVFSQFFVTAGTGKRFDRIYAKAPAIYRTLGGQFMHERFALGVTWVIPLHAENDPFLATPYGHYDLRQITHHVLLISGAFSL